MATKINNFEKIIWLIENHHIFLHATVNKNMPPTLPFEIGKPLFDYSTILHLDEDLINLSQLSTNYHLMSTFFDCFQTCRIVTKFRQCSNLIVVTTLVNISVRFSTVLIFCRRIFPSLIISLTK